MSDSTINFQESDAFLAFSKPNENDHHLHLVDVFNLELSDKNNARFDFLIMPFANNQSLNVYLKYKEVFRNRLFTFRSQSKQNILEINKENYTNDVNQIIDMFGKTTMQKVVYSRVKKINNNNVDLGELYLRLKDKYPTAFTFIYNLPGIGCWIGATPELLLRKEDGLTKTVALAGTQRYENNGLPVVWGRKEVEEQAFIKDFIKSHLIKLSLDYKEYPTETKVAGKVCHIYNAYDIYNIVHYTELIKALHPGPAISGTPKSKAISCINDIEGHDRKYYTGYLGELKNDTFDLYINLRSMEVSRDYFFLYIGGGITKDSVAEDEWNETELKAQTLLNVIK